MPANFGIMGVFDLYFKVHKLFNLSFHPNIQPMMLFVEYYIFKMNENQSQLTARIRELATKFEYLFNAEDENVIQPNIPDQNEQ